MSTYPELRSTHCSSRALRCIEVDGKPTRISNRNASSANSFAAKWFAQLAPVNRDPSLLPFPPQCGCFAPLCDYPAWTKTTLGALLNDTASTAPDRSVLKLLSLHELSSVARHMPLTKVVSPRYAGVQAGGLMCGDSAANSSGSVPGTLDNQGKEARS